MAVYGLVDPRTGHVRYVGRAFNLRERGPASAALQTRPDNAGVSKAKAAWLLELRDLGLRPLVRLIEEVGTFTRLNRREAYWIKRARREGWPIFNVKPGGDGGTPLRIRYLRALAYWRAIGVSPPESLRRRYGR